MRSGKSPLILITDRYPFGQGEVFVANEVPFLAAEFEPLVVAPWTSADTTRELPQGTTLADAFLKRSLTPAARHASSLQGLFTERTCVREIVERGTEVVGVKRLVRLSSSLGRVRIARQSIEHLLRKYCPRAEPAVVYSYWLGPVSVASGQLRHRWPHIRVVSRAHRGDLYEEASEPPYLPLTGQAVRNSDAVFTISEHGREYLAKRFPDCRARLRVSRLGVDSHDGVADRSTDGACRVVSCSGLRPVKRVSLIVRGLSQWCEANPGGRVEWTHFGAGAEQDVVQQLAHQILPAEVTVSFRGEVPNEVVLDHYAHRPVDMFINVSRSEGVPVSIMEALSFGIPVLATDVGGSGELVGDANGRLLPSHPTPVEVANGIDRLLRRAALEPDWRSRIQEGQQASYDAATNYAAFTRELLRLTRA